MEEISKNRNRGGNSPTSGVFELRGIDDDVEAQMENHGTKEVIHLNLEVTPVLEDDTEMDKHSDQVKYERP